MENDKSESESNLESRISKIELKIIEQEHRLIPAVLNVFNRWSKKKERSASLKALAFILFSTRTVTAIGISITAIVGLIIANNTNILLTQQNDFIEQQTFLEESNRRSALTFELSSILDKIDEELDLIEAKDTLLNSSDSRYLSSRSKLILSPRLQGRIIAISNSLRPYKYLDQFGNLTQPLSPERGQLLVSLILSDVNIDYILGQANFEYSDLNGVDLQTKDITNVNLGHASLKGSNLSNTLLEGANFEYANLSNSKLIFSRMLTTNFKNSNLSGCDLDGCFLPSPLNFVGTNFENTKIRLAYVLDSSWLNNFFRLPNVQNNFTRSDYVIKKTLRPYFDVYPKEVSDFFSRDTSYRTENVVVYEIRNIIDTAKYITTNTLEEPFTFSF